MNVLNRLELVQDNTSFVVVCASFLLFFLMPAWLLQLLVAFLRAAVGLIYELNAIILAMHSHQSVPVSPSPSKMLVASNTDGTYLLLYNHEVGFVGFVRCASLNDFLTAPQPPTVR